MDSLKSRRWLRKLCLLYKLNKENSPAYLLQLYPEYNQPILQGIFKKVKTFFQEKKQTSKIISFLKL